MSLAIGQCLSQHCNIWYFATQLNITKHDGTKQNGFDNIQNNDIWHFNAQTMIHGPGLVRCTVSGAGMFKKLVTIVLRMGFCHLQ